MKLTTEQDTIVAHVKANTGLTKISAVACFTKEGLPISTYNSVSEAARTYNCRHQQISRACSTQFTFFLDMFWCYADEVSLKIELFTVDNATIQKEASIKSEGYSILCTDIKTQITTEYKSLTHAYQSLGASPLTIKKYIINKSIYNKKYIFKLKEQN